MPAHFLHPFFTGLFVLLSLSFWGSLQIWDVSALSVAQCAKVFSRSVGCFFTLLIISFAVQRCLMWQVPFVYFGIDCLCFWWLLKKWSPWLHFIEQFLGFSLAVGWFPDVDLSPWSMESWFFFIWFEVGSGFLLLQAAIQCPNSVCWRDQALSTEYFRISCCTCVASFVRFLFCWVDLLCACTGTRQCSLLSPTVCLEVWICDCCIWSGMRMAGAAHFSFPLAWSICFYPCTLFPSVFVGELCLL